MLPNFIIIGAMKGGTTSLYHYISSHPNITPSSIKETNFFKTNDDFNKGISWYESLFQGNSAYAFEASPNYTKRHIFPGVPARMHSVLPQVKLIYVVRDPIERMISHYIHNCSHGRERRTFSEIVNTTNNYLQTSKYYYQIQAFLEYYSKAKLLIVESEKLGKDTANVLSDVFTFLELSAFYNVDLLEKRFHTSSQKKRLSKLEQALCYKIDNPLLRAVIRKIIQSFQKPIERPTLSPYDREKLAEELAPDIELLRGFSGLDFSDWSL